MLLIPEQIIKQKIQLYDTSFNIHALRAGHHNNLHMLIILVLIASNKMFLVAKEDKEKTKLVMLLMMRIEEDTMNTLV